MPKLKGTIKKIIKQPGRIKVGPASHSIEAGVIPLNIPASPPKAK